jgi:hypothetical protein
MTAILKVDTIQDTSGNNIINESSNTITIGASGDTVAIPSGATITGSGLGRILQVVTATDSTNRSSTSTSFVTASNTLSVDITPSSTSSKIFVLSSFTFGKTEQDYEIFATLFRDSTNLGNGNNGMTRGYDAQQYFRSSGAISILDAPSSTSELTYQVYIRSANASYAVKLNVDASLSSITAFEVGA